MSRHKGAPDSVPPIIWFLFQRAMEDKVVVERRRSAGDGVAEIRSALAWAEHFDVRRQAGAVECQLALIMLHRPDETGRCQECCPPPLGDEAAGSAFPCRTLRHLTSPFNNHPDLDQRWLQ